MDDTVIYTLNYNANGGDSAPKSETKGGNSSFAIFSVTDQTPHREGFVFLGWSHSTDGSQEIFAGDLFTVTSRETTLYAVWGEPTEVSESNEVDGETEPLGVFTASTASERYQVVGDALAFSFIGAAIILGLIALLLFQKRQPRIISKEEE